MAPTKDGRVGEPWGRKVPVPGFWRSFGMKLGCQAGAQRRWRPFLENRSLSGLTMVYGRYSLIIIYNKQPYNWGHHPILVRCFFQMYRPFFLVRNFRTSHVCWYRQGIITPHVRWSQLVFAKTRFWWAPNHGWMPGSTWWSSNMGLIQSRGPKIIGKMGYKYKPQTMVVNWGI